MEKEKKKKKKERNVLLWINQRCNAGKAISQLCNDDTYHLTDNIRKTRREGERERMIKVTPKKGSKM